MAKITDRDLMSILLKASEINERTKTHVMLNISKGSINICISKDGLCTSFNAWDDWPLLDQLKDELAKIHQALDDIINEIPNEAGGVSLPHAG